MKPRRPAVEPREFLGALGGGDLLLVRHGPHTLRVAVVVGAGQSVPYVMDADTGWQPLTGWIDDQLREDDRAIVWRKLLVRQGPDATVAVHGVHDIPLPRERGCGCGALREWLRAMGLNPPPGFRPPANVWTPDCFGEHQWSGPLYSREMQVMYI